MGYQYKLRAHHGMCIAFFQGRGYSTDFIVQMEKLIQQLKKNPIINICAQADSICCTCPNQHQGVCRTESKVSEYDRLVLKYCGLSVGMTMPYADFQEAVHKHILLSRKRSEICGNCQWDPICHAAELRYK